MGSNIEQPQDLTTSWEKWSPNSGFVATLKDRIAFSVSGNQISKIINGIKARQHDINETLIVVDIIARRTTSVSNTKHAEFTLVRQYAGIVHSAFDEALKCTIHGHDVRLLLDLEPKHVIKPKLSQAASRVWSFRLCVSSSFSNQLCFAEVFMHDNCNAKAMPINGARPGYVHNLCSTISRPMRNTQWLGLALEAESGAKLKGIYQPLQSTAEFRNLPASRQSFVSFHELLQNPPTSNGRACKVPERQRRSLSMRVPLYALILFSTAWCSELW